MIVDTDQLLEVAWQRAVSAGQLIRESWQKPKSIEYKGSIDLVTSVDRESERVIVATIQSHFPDHSILAEEETIVRGADEECRWIVDPLDGTTNFAHGYPQFCISIAFENRGIVMLGLVYDPVHHECLKAVRDGGARLKRRNNSRFATRSTRWGAPRNRLSLRSAQLCRSLLSYFKAFMVRSQGVHRGGSGALDLCYVASGRLDGFWEMKLKPWDVAAGALIVTEAGGVLSDFSGNAFSIYGQETLASNGLIQREMVEIASAVARATRVD